MLRIAIRGLLADFRDLEFGKWLAMAIRAAVMLLRLHLINNDLGALEVLQNFSLHSDTLKIRLANVELAIVLECQHATKVNLATFGGLG